MSIPITGVVYPLLNHYVIKPHTEEKKARLTNHHEKIIQILKNWHQININLSKNKTRFSEICIPLYTTVTDETELHDEFNEVISHLKSRHYLSTLEKLKQLDKTEREYNQHVESLIPKHEGRFLELTQNVKDVKIFDIKNSLKLFLIIFAGYP